MGACFSGLRPGWPRRPVSTASASGQRLNNPTESVKQSKDAQSRNNTAEAQQGQEFENPFGGIQAWRMPGEFVNAVYHPGWQVYQGDLPANMNLDRVSHLFFAFANSDHDGSSVLTDDHDGPETPMSDVNAWITALTRLRQEKYPALNLILSVGWEESNGIFDEVTADTRRLERFIRTTRRLVDILELNGIDIHWNHPSDRAQSERYTHLLACLRKALPHPHYFVTTAVPAKVSALEHMNLKQVSQHVDMINVMAYDFVGAHSGAVKSGHHAQLRSGDCLDTSTSGESVITYLLQQGVPAQKLVFGVPLYGRSFLGATGPYQSFDGYGGKDGIVEYKELPTTSSGEKAGQDESDVDAISPCAEQYDSKHVAAWCNGPQTQEGGGFVTYDNVASVKAKAEFVKERKLAGLFYWHMGYDKPKDQGSLVDEGGEILRVGHRRGSWWAGIEQ